MLIPSDRSRDPLGLTRVRNQNPARPLFPQQAEAVDPMLPLAGDELRVSVECLNIDSASFRQISEAARGDLAQIEARIVEIVRSRGKMHNPVTGSGGMLLGTVSEIGPHYPLAEKPVSIGDRIATLVSLSLTPLEINRVIRIEPEKERVWIEGSAILFSSGIFAQTPSDLPEAVVLSALDVAGAPAQTRRLVSEGDTVVVIGGGGKSGVLCLYEAKRKFGVRTLAVEPSVRAADRLKGLSFVDDVLQIDAQNPIAVMNEVWERTKGKMADVVINVANVPDTEMASLLSCRAQGVVYFFSMATSFTRAALGAEGLGLDIDLRIGNGYAEGHAELTLDLLRESDELRSLFETHYGE